MSNINYTPNYSNMIDDGALENYTDGSLAFGKEEINKLEKTAGESSDE